MREFNGKDSDGYRDINVRLKKGQFENETSIVQWWEVSDICDDSDPFAFIRKGQPCDTVMMILFNGMSVYKR